MKKITAIDLFAGIGGIKIALERAGFEVNFSNDIDRYCKITFDNYHKEKLLLRDIKDISSDEIPAHDLLAAGFPCQPFSMAGKQRGFDDERGSMFYQIIRILKDKRPKAFLLENVRHLERHHGGNTLKIMIELLTETGYHVSYKVLDSKNFGLPQKRPRIYIVGFLENVDFSFPEGNNFTSTVKDILETGEIDDWYYLSQKYYEGLVKHKMRHADKGHGFGFNVLDIKGYANTVVVGNMGRERNLIQDIVKPWFYKEGMDKAIMKNEAGLRKLTIREYARLQGLPDNYEFPVTRTQAYKQIGNSVAIPVVTSVAQKIFNKLILPNAASDSPNFDSIQNDSYLRAGIV